MLFDDEISWDQTIALSRSRVSKLALLSRLVLVSELRVSCNAIISSADSSFVSVASRFLCIIFVPDGLAVTGRTIAVEVAVEDVLAFPWMWRMKAGMAGRQPQIIAQVISATLYSMVQQC